VAGVCGCVYADHFPPFCVQMLWWGMDESLAELFARHPSARGFEGNPMDVFHAEIGESEYGPDETPGSIGLYGGRYCVVFHPGKF